ncbi:MAG: hypothetical protein ACI9OU_000498 [Candidatus Promineifilaceae bacterium]|jgi:hypothetical protein
MKTGILLTTVCAMATAGTLSTVARQQGPRPNSGDQHPAATAPRQSSVDSREATPQASRESDAIRKQLMITDLRVVEDPVRTNPRSGDRAVWTFKHLMEQMAGDQDPAEFVMRWLNLWEQDQEVNGFTAPERPAIRERIIDPWLRASGGQRLNLAKAPFKLLAIVNRMDLRVHVDEQVLTGGEGRFVFGVLAPDGTALLPEAGPAPGGMTVILEYELPATNMRQLGEWARLWKELERFPLDSPDYNRHLERVTRRFTEAGSAPGKPNGSALNQLRSNDIALAQPWELREFVIDGDSGLLQQNTVALTPDKITLNGTPEFAAFINEHGADLAQGTAELDPAFFAASAMAGPFLLTDFPDWESRTFTTNVLFDPFYDVPWSAAGIDNNDVRHAFALNTCNGCHRAETGTGFLQIGFPAENDLPKSLKHPAALAGFLTGIEVPDPVEPDTIRTFGDLERRLTDFKALTASFGDDGRGRGPRGAHIPRFVH